jgi:hypothetical protein
MSAPQGREQPEIAYGGIGARVTLAPMLELMRRIAHALARRGWVLRTGGAPGADQAFAAGAHAAGGDCELFLPWPGFGGVTRARLERPSAAAVELAARHHPAWARLKPGARALLARNAHQVLGAELNHPARMLICWTPDASLTGASPDTGGTGQALRIAQHAGVPVINLAHPAHEAFAGTFLTRS